MKKYEFNQAANTGDYDFIDNFGDFNLWRNSYDPTVFVIEYHDNVNHVNPIQEKILLNSELGRLEATIVEFQEGSDDAGLINYLRELLYM